MNCEGVLQLWVKGENHLLVWGPPLAWETAHAYFTSLERPTVESLSRPGPVLPPTHRIVTKAWREEIALLYQFPADTEMSPAVRELLAELAARGVAPIGRES